MPWSSVKRFSRKYGVKVRLPYEAEWEYAARAGTRTKYYWGKNSYEICKYANVADRTEKKSNKYKLKKYVNCDDGYA